MSCKYKIDIKTGANFGWALGSPSLPSLQSWAGTSTKSLNKYLPRTGQPTLFACAGGRAHRRGYIGLPTEIFDRLSASVNLIHNNDDAAYLLPFLLLFYFLPERCFSSSTSLLPVILLIRSHQELYFTLKMNKILLKLTRSWSINSYEFKDLFKNIFLCIIKYFVYIESTQYRM